MNTWRKNSPPQRERLSPIIRSKTCQPKPIAVSGGGRRHSAAGAPTNADWWPNQLNLKILPQHFPLSAPMDKVMQEPRPGCRDQEPPCFDDEVVGLVVGRLWPLWAAFHSYGVAQRRYVPHRRRLRRGQHSDAQRFARLNRWPDNASLDKGVSVALADKAEVWPENLLGRPHDSRR